VCVLTQRPPEVSAMLKAIISDATAGLGRGREAVSDVRGDGKKRNRAAIRGDIFKKRARPRAGCERERASRIDSSGEKPRR
jgi:hypothetical protein